METYCASYKKLLQAKNLTKQNRLKFLSNCAICGKKNRLLLKIKKFEIIVLY